MRTRFTQPPGVSFLAIGLQTGFARGLEIDNPSGSWLYIPQVETNIPPYTLGWAFGFPYDVSSFDILAGQGPSGQISTIQGDAVVVYLTDVQIPNAVGSAPPGFIDNFTPELGALVAVNVQASAGAGGNAIAGTVGKRIRVRSIVLMMARGSGTGVGSGSQNSSNDDTVTMILNDNAGALGAKSYLSVGPDKYSDERIYPNGLDCAVGSPFIYSAQTEWSDQFIRMELTYELI